MIIRNKLLATLCICWLFTPIISYGVIIPTESINSVTIKNLLPKIDGNSLVLINIDNTILAPESKMFRYNNNPYIAFMDNLSNLAISNSSMNSIIASLILQRKMMLVENSWPNFIEKMKSQGAMVFGFVKTTPPCHLINNFEGWQYSQLQTFKINFTNKLNNQEIFRFDPHDGNAPIFYEGIIFTNTLNKAKTLAELFKIIPTLPTKIVIFENTETELKNINTYLRMVDIQYYGIKYLGAKQILGVPDIKVAKFQQETLLNTGQWLEDTAAEDAINNPKPPE